MHELKAVDFDFKTPSGMDRDQVGQIFSTFLHFVVADIGSHLSFQFFVVCVPSSTQADRDLEAQVKAAFPHLRSRGLLTPSGPLTPRILCCPNGSTFNPEVKVCQGPGIDYSDPKAEPEPTQDEDAPGNGNPDDDVESF